MKTKSLLPALIATALAFALNTTARAHDEQGTNNECDIHGNETMDAVVVLTTTTNAPAGARGVAKLEAENDGGDEEATIELKLVGLNPGDYFLSVNLQPTGTNATGTNVVLGGITIGIRNDDDEGDHFERDHLGNWWAGFPNSGTWTNWIHCNLGGFTNWGGWTNWSVTNWCNASNRVTVTEAEVDLPAGLNPTDIGQIVLSDTNGNAILVGDLVKPATNTVINISATVRLIPGAAAPSATGVAQLQSAAVKGKWNHQFNLTASGMGTNSNFRVYVNQKKTGATRSSKTGQLTVKKLPSRIPAVRSFRLLDAKGNEAARVQF